jgi:hypothetical protein
VPEGWTFKANPPGSVTLLLCPLMTQSGHCRVPGTQPILGPVFDTPQPCITSAPDSCAGCVSFFPAQFWLGLAVVIFSITSLTVKLAALARGGNSLKLSMYFATIICAGTNANARRTCQSA